jgi:hypothetical protein
VSDDSDPAVLLENVCDQDTFVAFLYALASDYAREREIEAASSSPPYSSGKFGWENGAVDAVLGAASNYADATRRQWSASDGRSISNRCARILLMGKYYE